MQNKQLPPKKKKFNWRRWNRIIHRDFGYIFFGMTIIYALSGIALNHLDDWNPNYSVTLKSIEATGLPEKEAVDKPYLEQLLAANELEGQYKKHFFKNSNTLKVFLKSGSLVINMQTGVGEVELIRKRPVFYQFNSLHYNNPKNLWTWFSDIYAGALILLAISGLFIIRGKKGITGRGAWLTSAGIIIPAILYIIYH